MFPFNSSFFARRDVGHCKLYFAKNSCDLNNVFSVISVSNSPGQTEFTVIPN